MRLAAPLSFCAFPVGLGHIPQPAGASRQGAPALLEEPRPGEVERGVPAHFLVNMEPVVARMEFPLTWRSGHQGGFREGQGAAGHTSWGFHLIF